MLHGLQDFDKGKNVRLLAIDGIRLILSKCQIDGVSHVDAYSVSMTMRCVDNQIAVVDYELSDDGSAKVSVVKFWLGAPPRININTVVKDD